MRRSALLLTVAFAIACGRAPDAEERTREVASRFTSREATLVYFDFDGVIATDETDTTVVRSLIGAQIMYTVGALNAESSVSRAARVAVASITDAHDGTFHYRARLPVAWGQTAVPSSYELTLPRRAGAADQAAFASKYGGGCVAADAGPPPIDASAMFLHFRPHQSSCALEPNDIVAVTATVTRSPDNATGKYPEYDRIWDDKRLEVVALFSRADTVEATGDDDEGARAYARFVHDLRQYLDVPNDVMPLEKDLPDGRTVRVDARMVDHVLDATSDIDLWYSNRTTEADLILYNGHAGLGGNIHSLMQKGVFRPGKYVIFSLNACDTFAYLDDTLAARRAVLNPDDPTGTKYMDVISNAMPGYFGDGPLMSLTLIRALIDPPATYDDILSRLDPAQAANVTGEEDNAFVPSASSLPPAPTNHVPPSPAPGDPGIPPDVDDDPPAPTADATAHATKPASCSFAPGARASSAFPLLALVAASAAVRRRRAAWRTQGLRKVVQPLRSWLTG